MAATMVALELPEELVALVGSPEAVSARAREALVLDLLRHAEISQGFAARMLGITRWDILALMARHAIPSGPLTAEEVDREIKAAQLGVQSASIDGGGEQ